MGDKRRESARVFTNAGRPPVPSAAPLVDARCLLGQARPRLGSRSHRLRYASATFMLAR